MPPTIRAHQRVLNYLAPSGTLKRRSLHCRSLSWLLHRRSPLSWPRRHGHLRSRCQLRCVGHDTAAQDAAAQDAAAQDAAAQDAAARDATARDAAACDAHGHVVMAILGRDVSRDVSCDVSVTIPPLKMPPLKMPPLKLPPLKMPPLVMLYRS